MSIFYGLKDAERLHPSLESCVQDALDVVGDDGWPIEVLEFERMKPDAKWLADNALESLLDTLDADYSDPEGTTKPTEKMREAARAFVDAVLVEYVVWPCEPNGNKTVVTLEEAKRMADCE